MSISNHQDKRDKREEVNGSDSSDSTDSAKPKTDVILDFAKNEGMVGPHDNHKAGRMELR